MTIAAAGETLCTRRHSCFTDEPFLNLVSLIRGADVACTNLETRVHTFKGYPMPLDSMGSEQSYQQADPFVADELRWMGFSLLGRSNNHGMDFGAEMLFEEAAILDQAGFVHAGAGKNLAEATRPGYLETNKGRVALVSLCTDFPPHCPAGEQGPNFHGRPGINVVRHDVRYHLDGEKFQQLSDLMTTYGMEKSIRGKQILAFNNVFEKSENNFVAYSVNLADQDRNCKTISDAKKAADYVIVHMHQETEGHFPAPRIRDLARNLVDAGADVIVGDGPHLLQGIEIYKGRPIFYSLGNFFYESETIKLFPPDFYERSGLGRDALPQDAIDYRDAVRSGKLRKDDVLPLRAGNEYMEWFEAIVAEIEFEGGQLSAIRLHPVWTHHEKRPQRGVPRLAEPQVADRILKNMDEYSKGFNTTIERSNGVGIIYI